MIAEGAGGALVPYSRDNLIIDIAKDLNLPVLIVVGNKLGAINHSLLTIEAIRFENPKQYKNVTTQIEDEKLDGKMDAVNRKYYCKFVKGEASYFDPDDVDKNENEVQNMLVKKRDYQNVKGEEKKELQFFVTFWIIIRIYFN